jgi:hypothetical protein
LEQARESAGFPQRCNLLLGAARRSASAKRRAMLAAVLYGLPLTDMPEDDRDHVDMLVERLTIRDVTLLQTIYQMETTIPDNIMGWLNMLYVIRAGDELRIVPAQLIPNKVIDEDILSVPDLPRDKVALGQLQALGLVELTEGNERGPVVVAGKFSPRIHGLRTTPLALLLLRALEDVRAGMEAT